jgi:hypothetical protein
MKIANSETRPVSGLARSSEVGPASEGGRSGSAAGPPSTADRVQLSNLGANLTSAMGDSPMYLKRLSDLSTAALSGAYQVEAGTVSDSIIRHSLQVGGANYL